MSVHNTAMLSFYNFFVCFLLTLPRFLLHPIVGDVEVRALSSGQFAFEIRMLSDLFLNGF